MRTGTSRSGAVHHEPGSPTDLGIFSGREQCSRTADGKGYGSFPQAPCWASIPVSGKPLQKASESRQPPRVLACWRANGSEYIQLSPIHFLGFKGSRTHKPCLPPCRPPQELVRRGTSPPMSVLAKLVARDDGQMDQVYNNSLPSAICSYPLSGQYGPGTRILYYGLVAVCIFARRHEWLREPCLAAALLLPALASIHAIVLGSLSNSRKYQYHWLIP